MRILFLLFLIPVFNQIAGQKLYEMPAGTQSRVSSFENPNGIKGNGGKTNKTAKGNAYEPVQPGETKTLLNINGEGNCAIEKFNFPKRNLHRLYDCKFFRWFDRLSGFYLFF